tara:strand:+ start:7260 stop:7424 length:165 start_codon:yes stop_codon:yes gene_type:complete
MNDKEITIRLKISEVDDLGMVLAENIGRRKRRGYERKFLYELLEKIDTQMIDQL